MSETRFITTQALAELTAELLAAGTRVVAPAEAADGAVDYQVISNAKDVVLDERMPRRSLRGFFQPPTEQVFTWNRTDSGFSLKPVDLSTEPWVVLGARPCDAAGAAAIDAVMNGEPKDDLWMRRRETVTVIGLACAAMGPGCFCELVGKGPANTTGSDILLRPAQGGSIVEIVTPRGQAFVEAHSAKFTSTDAEVQAPPKRYDPAPMDRIEAWLEANFNDEFWQELSLRCLGCGTCTSICPTCYCFDIVDEPVGTSAGARRRNWDTCQVGLFTLHASGHNPRPEQTNRCRQRIMHKFYIYPHRHDILLCTGCGRCVVACPTGVNLPEILTGIAGRAGEDTTMGGPA